MINFLGKRPLTKGFPKEKAFIAGLANQGVSASTEYPHLSQIRSQPSLPKREGLRERV
ncbi:hypothetical protein MPNT_20061 [Candidatus Methylacidithermus pantelleriae]|uniref:Uncharacterized protein n=1 Tax=Candidatus Methylacidithermus pantelleriae TaxID=2744239 RepID=A0A8J2BLA5_9BACT|nr:hypothetical protein MPNT_20061 [Candidatus Methylacidithermus pantelleriae]